MTPFIKTLVIIGSLLSFLMIKIWMPNYIDDNVIEESIEEIIQYETDIDIDVTPMSPEKK